MNIKLSDHFTYKKLIRYSLPSIMMMIFTSIYGVWSAIIVAEFVAAAMSAIFMYVKREQYGFAKLDG